MVDAKKAYEIAKRVAESEDQYIVSQSLIGNTYWFAVVPNKYRNVDKVYDLNLAYSIDVSDGQIYREDASSFIRASMHKKEEKIDISQF